MRVPDTTCEFGFSESVIPSDFSYLQYLLKSVVIIEIECIRVMALVASVWSVVPTRCRWSRDM